MRGRPTPLADPLLTVVMPIYNERATVEEIIDRVLKVPLRIELIAVDDASTDGSREIVKELAARRGFKHLVQERNQGKGAAVRRGILAGRAPLVGFFDADLATPLDTLPAAIAALRGGAAAAIASRHVPGARFVETQPLTRRLGGHVFRTLSGALVSGVADTQSGFKFLPRPVVTAALVRTRTTGFAFDVELLHRIQRDGGEVVELPVAWTDRAGSTFHPVRDGIASYRAVLALHGGVR